MTGSLVSPGKQIKWSQVILSMVVLAALVWSYWPAFTELAVRWATDPHYSHGYVVPVFALLVLWARCGDGHPLSRLGDPSAPSARPVDAARNERSRRSQGEGEARVDPSAALARPADEARNERSRRSQGEGEARAELSWVSTLWGLGLILLGAVVRLGGTYFYLRWLDYVSLLPSASGLVLLTGGWPLLRWAWPALALGFFMLPLPHQFEMMLAFPLRRLATVVSSYTLQLFGIPALAEGNIIVIEEMRIGVVEACSGLGMLMTFFALSTAMAFVIRRPLIHKWVLFFSAVPIGVGMNVLRICVTSLLFYLVNSEVAHVVFHDLAGWIMMPLALVVLWLEVCYLDRLLVTPVAGPVPLAFPSGGPQPVPPAPRHHNRPTTATLGPVRHSPVRSPGTASTANSAPAKLSPWPR